jgi:RimJ/RimL family protein N-acetyltransferase
MALEEKFLLKNNFLCLRPLRLDDVPSVQQIVGHPLVAPVLASIGTPWPKSAVQAWITARQYRGKPGFCAAIVLPERAVIGVAGLGPNSADGPCSCAYFMDPQHWGLGYASEAMGAFLAYFMRKFDLSEVAADHFDDNPVSGAVLRKLGFQELGKGSGKSQARLEPAPVTLYRLRLDDLKAVL